MPRIPRALWMIVKEAARHLLRRPVVGIAAVATTPSGAVVLIRRGDTGEWALPGGTLEWGETLRSAITRELREEIGAHQVQLGALLGAYSDPGRDPRFHAVTLLVAARVGLPLQPPINPLEVLEVRSFPVQDLPDLGLGMSEMLQHALGGEIVWE